MRGVILVAEARLVVELAVSGVDCLLRVFVHPHSKLVFDRLLESVALANGRLTSKHVQHARQRDIVPVHVEQYFIQICNEVSLSFIGMLVLIIVSQELICVDVSANSIFEQALLWNISVPGQLEHHSLAL